MMQRAIVDLPQPDSPTTPSVSPWRTVNETSSTACTAPTCFWKTIPRVTGKYFFRFSTTSSSSPKRRSGSRRAQRRRSVGASGLARAGRVAHATHPRRSPRAWRPTPRRGSARRGDSGTDGRRPSEVLELGHRLAADVHRELAARVERAARAAVAAATAAGRRSAPGAPGSRPRAAASRAGPTCTGICGRLNSSSTLARSTIRPPYMTTTSSASSATTPRSCVIMMIAMSNSRCRSCIRFRICACVVTSSAVVGSSAIRISGLLISAIAIITRCRMPPENWCG